MLCKQVIFFICLVGVQSSKKPHILYVVMDDQGYGDVGNSEDVFRKL